MSLAEKKNVVNFVFILMNIEKRQKAKRAKAKKPKSKECGDLSSLFRELVLFSEFLLKLFLC